MEKIRAIIIDDEDHCRSSLTTQLEWSCPQVEVIAEGKSADEGVELIKKHKPDLVFLDIEMPGGTGFDMIEMLPHVDFKLVFTTAFDEYALQAFKVNAIAYLLKPIDEDELIRTVEKVVIEKNDIVEQKLEKLMQYLSSEHKSGKIAVPVSDGLQFITTDKIIRCEADGNYCTIHLLEGKKLVISKTLKHISDLIQQQNFVRVHQSHIINMNYIKKYIRGKNGQIIMDDGSVIPVSRSKKDDFLEKF
ncbi:MAG: response regulator [Saprospiraceae bacterium]|nr:response regulator [Saprospiraceae bacterium]